MCSIRDQVGKEPQLCISRLWNWPCLQAKGRISAEQRCQSWPSCRCGRRCLRSLCWQKHPAKTWGQSAARAACDWTCTRGHLEEEDSESERVKRQTKNAVKKKVAFLPPLFSSSSTFSDRILTFFFFSSCMMTLLLGAAWKEKIWLKIWGEKKKIARVANYIPQWIHSSAEHTGGSVKTRHLQPILVPL